MPEPTPPAPSPPSVNFTLLTELSTKPHPLLNIEDDFSAQLQAIPDSWIGEIFQEARNAHHLLDMAGIPHGKGYAQDLDSRMYQALRVILDQREQLARIAGWHSQEKGPAGTVGSYCNECGHLWPCDTRRMAEGTYTDDAKDPDVQS